MFRWLKKRRYKTLQRKALAACTDAQLRAVLDGTPSLQTPWSEVEFLVVDLETTGLNPSTSHIVSIGSVIIRSKRVRLGSASHMIIRGDHSVGASAKIHGVRDQDLEHGVPLQSVLRSLLENLANKVVVFHYSELDRNMLNDAFTELYGAPLVVPVIDTLKLAKRVLANEATSADSFRLGALRKRFGLPQAKQHNALSDAIATAELLLVLLSQLDLSGQEPVIAYVE